MPHHNRARLADISEKNLDPTKSYVTDKNGKLTLKNQVVILKTKTENVSNLLNVELEEVEKVEEVEEESKVLESSISLEENSYFKAVNNKKNVTNKKSKKQKTNQS